MLEHGTLHQSGVGGLSPSAGIFASNMLYILRYLADVPATAAPSQSDRFTVISGNFDGSLANTAASTIDPKFWAAIETVLAAPVCSSDAVNYNPTMANPVDQSNVQNLFCVHMLIKVLKKTLSHRYLVSPRERTMMRLPCLFPTGVCGHHYQFSRCRGRQHAKPPYLC